MNNYSMSWLSDQKSVCKDEKRNISKIVVCRGDYSAADHCALSRLESVRKTMLKHAYEELQNAAVSCDTENHKDNKGFEVKIICEKELPNEAYRINCNGKKVSLSASSAEGILYGAFAITRTLALGELKEDSKRTEIPKNPLRMINHWDNIDGSIERGYSGKSFFMKDGKVLTDERTGSYARMCASVGINGIVINNVNVRGAATSLIDIKYLKRLKKLSDILNGYGVKLYLSLNYAAPMELSDLQTADPLDENVIQWWKEKMSEIYREIPMLGGFLVKADSEGRPGPFTYGRTHADGANMLADAVKPYGGLIIWRCFVYNCQQDWRDRKTDRARAGYDNFMPIDGEFENNVILQIKNGPMDFQIREPVSPLFGGLTKTNQMLEVQAAQEYTGQQKHVCYLVPIWKETLNFHTYMKGTESDTVADIVSGRTLHQQNCGMAAVSNTGDDFNWFGHDLAAVNFYGFGRLAWNTELTAEQIAREWTVLMFGFGKVSDTVTEILMESRTAYENYSSPLGIGWMVNPNQHYGPNVDGYEYDRWGTYHRADCYGIGVDRTESGTGYTKQYNDPNASMYESATDCPEELLLFFHYVTYKTKLKCGKTLIQYIYDSHFEGAKKAAEFLEKWRTLKPLVNSELFERVESRFVEQKSSAEEWRDVVNTYFYRKSGIADEKNRMIY